MTCPENNDAEQRPRRFSFRLTAPLPLTINGGLTRWRIHKEYFDKGGKHVAIVADCIETKESIILARGYTRSNDHTIATRSMSVEVGSKGHQIAKKLVRDGWAQAVAH